MTTYIWQLTDWPKLQWNSQCLITALSEARHQQGLFLGRMLDIGFDARLESELEATCDNVLKTSAIEGEVLNPASVRSSIARRLGIPDGGYTTDRKVDGVVDMIMDATKNYKAPLSAARLYGWHAALFPTGYSGKDKIDVGQWRSDRDGAMQVVSNVYAAKPRIHFQAPPAERISDEMKTFIAWFNDSQGKIDPLLRTGLAHLWFVTIHPMDDGNGRIARAVSDLAVAQMEQTGQRFYSMSSQIERDKRQYYDALELTQKGGLDVTDWLEWFAGCYKRSILAADMMAGKVIAKAQFWAMNVAIPFSDRQRKVLSKLLDGFDGHLTSKKWCAICGCSVDTAQRDINDLIAHGLLIRNPGGSKSTSYAFNWPSSDRALMAKHNTISPTFGM